MLLFEHKVPSGLRFVFVREVLCVQQKTLFRPQILLYSAKAGYAPDYNDYSDTDDEDDDNDDFDDNNADDNNADGNNGEDDDNNDHNLISRSLTV